jgi:hypothetical protein
MRSYAASPWPSMHWAYTRSGTATLWPAHSATCAAGTPALSHSDTQAWRRSYGRRAIAEAASRGVNAACLALRQVLP